MQTDQVVEFRVLPVDFISTKKRDGNCERLPIMQDTSSSAEIPSMVLDEHNIEIDQNDDISFFIEESPPRSPISDQTTVTTATTTANPQEIVANGHSLVLPFLPSKDTHTSIPSTNVEIEQNAIHIDKKVMTGKCIEYVDMYLDGTTGDCSRLWTNPNWKVDKEYFGKQKVHHKKKHMHTMSNDQHPITKCILSIDYSNEFYPIQYNTTFRRPKGSSSKVGIGHKYQAVIPKYSNRQRSTLCNKDTIHSSTPIKTWDPRLADHATRNGEDIEAFLSQGETLNTKLVLMQALHDSKYNVLHAKRLFVSLYNDKPRSFFDYGDRGTFHDFFTKEHFAKLKDFDYISQKLKCSKEVALINYYKWKKSKPDNPIQYLQMKRERNKESDYCEVCGNGGTLIVCDQCNHAYHTTCLQPPLTVVPHGDWFCPGCERRSPAKLRRLSGYNKIYKDDDDDVQHIPMNTVCRSHTAIVHQTSSTLPPLHSTVSHDRLESLKSIHKELSISHNTPRRYSTIEQAPVGNETTKVATYSPKGMSWDYARGLWVEASNGNVRNHQCDSDIQNNVTSTTTSLAATRHDANSNGARGLLVEASNGRSHQLESTIQHGIASTATSLAASYPDAEQSVIRTDHVPSVNDNSLTAGSIHPILGYGVFYEVRLPIVEEGLLIYIEKTSKYFTSFKGYRHTSTGAMGFAQRIRAFIADGDFIVAVDNIICFNKTFDEVRTLVKTRKPGVKVRCLTMFHPYNAAR